jgi:hypothetical protein
MVSLDPSDLLDYIDAISAGFCTVLQAFQAGRRYRRLWEWRRHRLGTLTSRIPFNLTSTTGEWLIAFISTLRSQCSMGTTRLTIKPNWPVGQYEGKSCSLEFMQISSMERVSSTLERRLSIAVHSTEQSGVEQCEKPDPAANFDSNTSFA